MNLILKRIKVLTIATIMIITSIIGEVSIYAKEKEEEITRKRIIEDQLTEGLRDELIGSKDVHRAYTDKELIETCDLVIKAIIQYKLSKSKVVQLGYLKDVIKKHFKEKYNEDIESRFSRLLKWVPGPDNIYSKRLNNYVTFIDAYNQFKEEKDTLRARIFDGLNKVFSIIKGEDQYKKIKDIIERYEAEPGEMTEEEVSIIKEILKEKVKEVSKREKIPYDGRIEEVFTDIFKRKEYYMNKSTIGEKPDNIEDPQANYYKEQGGIIEEAEMEEFEKLIKEEYTDIFNYPLLQQLSKKETWLERDVKDKLLSLTLNIGVSLLILKAFGFNIWAAPFMFGDTIINTCKDWYYTKEKRYELEKVYKTDGFIDSFFSKDRYIKRRESEIQRLLIYDVWKREILKRRKDLTEKYIEEKLRHEEEIAERCRKNTGKTGITTTDMLQMIYIYTKVSKNNNDKIEDLKEEILNNIERLRETYKEVYKGKEKPLLDLDYINKGLDAIILAKEFIMEEEEKKKGNYDIEIDVKEWKRTYKDSKGNIIEIIKEVGGDKYYRGNEEVEVDNEGNITKDNISKKTKEELKKSREEAMERKIKEMIEKYNYCRENKEILREVIKNAYEMPNNMYFPSINEIESKNKGEYDIRDMKECRWNTYESDVNRETMNKLGAFGWEIAKSGCMIAGLGINQWKVLLELVPVLTTNVYNTGRDLYKQYYYSNDCYKEIDYKKEEYFKSIDKEILREEDKKVNHYRSKTGDAGVTREDIVELIVLKKMIEKKLKLTEEEIKIREKERPLSFNDLLYKLGSDTPYYPGTKADYSILDFINEVIREAKEKGKEIGLDVDKIDIEDKYIKYDSLINIPASKFIQRESQKNLNSYNKVKWPIYTMIRIGLLINRINDIYKKYKAEEALYNEYYYKRQKATYLDIKCELIFRNNNDLTNDHLYFGRIMKNHENELNQLCKYNENHNFNSNELNQLKKDIETFNIIKNELKKYKDLFPTYALPTYNQREELVRAGEILINNLKNKYAEDLNTINNLARQFGRDYNSKESINNLKLNVNKPYDYLTNISNYINSEEFNFIPEQNIEKILNSIKLIQNYNIMIEDEKILINEWKNLRNSKDKLNTIINLEKNNEFFNKYMKNVEFHIKHNINPRIEDPNQYQYFNSNFTKLWDDFVKQKGYESIYSYINKNIWGDLYNIIYNIYEDKDFMNYFNLDEFYKLENKEDNI